MTMMRFEDAVRDIDVIATRGDLSVTVEGVSGDSRSVDERSIFCCVSGVAIDGHDFAAAALDAGAVALVVERFVDLDVPQVLVDDVREVIGPLAAEVYGHPSKVLDVIGVTGTNGKTTTTFMLRNILEQAGLRTEVLGTLSGERTTPEAPELQRQLARWVDEGVHAVAMEVSSHALAQHRVDGMRFRVAVFTNLSRDHLDFHRSTEAYFEAKSRLFEPSMSRIAVVDLDDPHGRLLRDPARISTTGFSGDFLGDVEVGVDFCRFTWRGFRVEVPIGGRFNVANAHAAAEAASALGIASEVIVDGLARPLVVPGRFETIEEGQPFGVIVDFAHTPDGLERLLASTRETVRDRDGDPGGDPDGEGGRVIVVFGCGGDRDRSKRPMMGEIAARLADVVVLTADNSRSEDTAAIVDEIREGFERGARGVAAPTLLIEHDREAAIRAAFDEAREGDVVVIAGKGHETTQTLGDTVIPFDDRVVARAILARRLPSGTDTEEAG